MNLCIVNEDHPQCTVPRKEIKACQGKGQSTVLLREWSCRPFSSTGLGTPCEFVSSQPQPRGHCRPVPASGLGYYFLVTSVGKEEIVNSQWRQPLTQVIKAGISPVRRQVVSCPPWQDMRKGAWSLWFSCPKSIPQSTNKKTLDKCKLRDILQNTWLVLFESAFPCKARKRLRNSQEIGGD